jgi:hypothetical protein
MPRPVPCPPCDLLERTIVAHNVCKAHGTVFLSPVHTNTLTVYQINYV